MNSLYLRAMTKKLIVLVVLLAIFTIDVNAQCSMCSAVAESSQRNGNDFAEGLNAGILYLMGIPYILLMGLGILLFRRLNKQQVED